MSIFDERSDSKCFLRLDFEAGLRLESVKGGGIYSQRRSDRDGLVESGIGLTELPEAVNCIHRTLREQDVARRVARNAPGTTHSLCGIDNPRGSYKNTIANPGPLSTGILIEF